MIHDFSWLRVSFIVMFILSRPVGYTSASVSRLFLLPPQFFPARILGGDRGTPLVAASLSHAPTEIFLQGLS